MIRSAASFSSSLRQHRTLLVAGIAHALHDGYTDMIYVLLPVWRTQFVLGYGAVALLRSLYSGAMATLQVSAGAAAHRYGSRMVLVLGTAMAALGYLMAGITGTLPGLCVALTVAGAGSSTQHPIGSGAVSRVYGSNARGPLGVYNFSGDLGKASLPVALSLLLTVLHWQSALRIMAVLGVLVAIAIALLMPPLDPVSKEAEEPTAQTQTSSGRGWWLLFAIGVLDTASRMGLLIFLPFIFKAKGASLPTVGVALAAVFIGGAAGKFACGWLGDRIGMLRTVLFTEGGTAVAILLVLALPLVPALMMLPLLGIMLNGTSSVLYGTVPELTYEGKAEHAFALFYTGTIGSGAIAPVLFGMLGDAVGVSWATIATAITALATLPLAMALAPHLSFD